MKKALCILFSLGLLMMIISSVTAQSTGCFDAAGGAIPCPDRDGDGVQDANDRCISDVGPASNNGCPESQSGGAGSSGNGDVDNDGVADSIDQCATVAGVSEHSGCPGPSPTPIGDSDADGENDSIDQCLTQPGPAENKGCPLDTTAGTGPTATPAPSTVQLNPLVPPSDGPCQLTTRNTTAVNVRAEPSLNASIVGSLDPNLVYIVLSAIVNSEGTWYRVEAGWVSAIVVNIGGTCPARIIAVGPSGFSISQADYDAVKGGIYPDSHCFDLFNGIRYCHTVLKATADDGSTEGTVPWNINVCGFGPGGVKCTLLEFTDFVEDECPPEFCEPAPSNPYPGPNPNDPDTDGAVYCKTLLDDLALPSDNPEGPYYTLYFPGRGLGFGVKLPPVDPQPCLVEVFIVREDAAANGQIPVDRLLLETELPPPAAYDAFMYIDGIDGETSDTRPAPSVTLFNVARLDLNGNVCITATHGDFQYCPGQPQPAPGDRSAFPEPVLDYDLLMSLAPTGGDPTASFTCDYNKNNGVVACSCNNSTACNKMARFCESAPTTCYGNVCGCGHMVDYVGGDEE
jgi:hypothetical protein